MKRKLILNTVSPIFMQLITIVCGLILPRLYLGAYGSRVNGLVSSITSFLSIISLLDMGVSTVVQVAFYQPLAENNQEKINQVYIASSKFFKKIAYFLSIYVFVLIWFYPMLIDNIYDHSFISCLIIVVALGTFMQYFFGITNQILLNADQYIYIQAGTQCVLLIINVGICSMLINAGASIVMVRLISTIVFLIRPLVMQIFVHNHYTINKKIDAGRDVIKQKWNGATQFLANYVLSNTDVVILTAMSTLENVSIYTVYNNVVYGIRLLIMAMGSGFQSMWGRLYVEKKMGEIIKSFDFFEWVLHNVVTMIFTVAGAVIVPFVKIYTSNATDLNYEAPLFAVVLIMATAVLCYRLPYISMIYAVGHFKETQKSAVIEMLINIVASIFLVHKYDLIGVAFGTLLAMIYRTLYLVLYLKNNILNRELECFIKRMIANCTVIVLFVYLQSFILMSNLDLISWIIYATKLSMLILCISFVVNFIFEYSKCKKIVIKLKGR